MIKVDHSLFLFQFTAIPYIPSHNPPSLFEKLQVALTAYCHSTPPIIATHCFQLVHSVFSPRLRHFTLISVAFCYLSFLLCSSSLNDWFSQGRIEHVLRLHEILSFCGNISRMLCPSADRQLSDAILFTEVEMCETCRRRELQSLKLLNLIC